MVEACIWIRLRLSSARLYLSADWFGHVPSSTNKRKASAFTMFDALAQMKTVLI